MHSCRMRTGGHLERDGRDRITRKEGGSNSDKARELERNPAQTKKSNSTDAVTSFALDPHTIGGGKHDLCIHLGTQRQAKPTPPVVLLSSRIPCFLEKKQNDDTKKKKASEKGPFPKLQWAVLDLNL